MKLIRISLLATLIMMGSLLQAQVAVNNTGADPDPDAMLDVQSTNKGFLVPRMSVASRPASPPAGMIIFQIDNGPGFYIYGSTGWNKVGTADFDYWQPSGSDIYYTNGNVAVGMHDADDHGLNVNNYYNAKAAIRGGDQDGTAIYAEGFLGVLDPSNLGIPVSVYNIGVLGIKPNNGANGAAIYGWNNDNNQVNYAGLFVADGESSSTNYGVYASATGSENNYAGYFTGRLDVQGSSTDQDAGSTVINSTVNHSLSVDTRAINGYSVPATGFGYGVYGTGGYTGIKGKANATNSLYSAYGVWGDATGNRTSGQTHYGVYGEATGTGGINVGVYGYASGGTTNWAAYFSGDAHISSDLRIATTTQASGYALSVNGKVACEEVLVQDMGSWPDYVFSDEYDLMSLEELEKSIQKNNHLPGIPSAGEIEENGLHLGNMQKLVIEKLEELTLYTIEQGKMIDELKKEIELLKAENSSLKKSVSKK